MNESRPSSRSIPGLLRSRNFSLLWIGAVTSASGFYVGNVVIEWLLYGSSHNALFLTIFGVIEFVPTLTIGVFAGALADRYNRRRLMISSDLARAATMGALALYVLAHGFNLPVVLAAVLVTGAFGTIFSPSSSAILPSLIEKSQLASGNGLLQAGTTVAGFVGSPLGGVLIVVAGVGAGLIFNSVTFAISALMIGLMIVPVAVSRTPDQPPEGDSSVFSDVRAGFRFLRAQRGLLIITLGAMGLNFFTFYILYVVVYVSGILHGGPGLFGLVVGVQAAGYAAGALLGTSRLRMDRAPGIWIPIVWGVSGLPLILMILIPLVPVALAGAATLGVLSAVTNVTFIAVAQRTIPDEFLGRYFATDQAGSYAMIPAGLVAGGVLIVAFGVGFAFVLAGVGTLVLGLLLLLSGDVRRWGIA